MPWQGCILRLLEQSYDWQAGPESRERLLREGEETLVGIVDWEMACIGDLAYDLAIVNRGNRKVHGVKGGVTALVGECLAFGGRPITATDVHVRELRVKDFDFSRSGLLLSDANGQKDRLTMLLVKVQPALREHVEIVRRQPDRDLVQCPGRAPLPAALAGEYPSANHE